MQGLPPPLPPPALRHHSLRLIPDPRGQRRPVHAVPGLLFVSLCSLLTGGDSFQDMKTGKPQCVATFSG